MMSEAKLRAGAAVAGVLMAMVLAVMEVAKV